MFTPVILGSDKTTVSVATGQNEYYPLYASIGNVQNHVRRAHHNALAIIGFLAIPKSMLQCPTSSISDSLMGINLNTVSRQTISGHSSFPEILLPTLPHLLSAYLTVAQATHDHATCYMMW